MEKHFGLGAGREGCCTIHMSWLPSQVWWTPFCTSLSASSGTMSTAMTYITLWGIFRNMVNNIFISIHGNSRFLRQSGNKSYIQTLIIIITKSIMKFFSYPKSIAASELSPATILSASFTSVTVSWHILGCCNSWYMIRIWVL